jgi:hypothetical protein
MENFKKRKKYYQKNEKKTFEKNPKKNEVINNKKLRENQREIKDETKKKCIF